MGFSMLEPLNGSVLFLRQAIALACQLPSHTQNAEREEHFILNIISRRTFYCSVLSTSYYFL